MLDAKEQMTASRMLPHFYKRLANEMKEQRSFELSCSGDSKRLNPSRIRRWPFKFPHLGFTEVAA